MCGETLGPEAPRDDPSLREGGRAGNGWGAALQEMTEEKQGSV